MFTTVFFYVKIQEIGLFIGFAIGEETINERDYH